ncbi:MAG TPA: GAF domain-containing protein [Lapillicoccus sp.]
MALDPEPRVDPDRPPSAYASLGAVDLDDLLRDLDGLLGELGERAASASGAHARLGALLDAVVAVTSGLELADVLSRITRAACSLAGARYGALGVLGPSGERLVEFITEGVTAAERAAIGDPPQGHGVLGLLIRNPRPQRLRDIREHPESFGFPPNHPPMRSFLGAPIRIRDKVFGNLYLAEKEGPEEHNEFSADDESVVVALASAAGVAIENARLYDTSRRRALASAAIGDLTHALLEGRDEGEALCAFASAVATIAAATRVGVVLHDDGGRRYVAATSWGADLDSDSGASFEDDVWDTLEKSREPVVLLADTPDRTAESQPSVAAALRVDPASPAAVLNLAPGDPDVGLVLVAWDRSHAEPLVDLRELAELARHAGLALLAGRTRHTQSRMALLEDRERIARDMHDHVIQRLFATGLSLQTAAQVSTDPLVQNRVDEAVDALDASIREIRMTIFELSQTGTDLSAEAQLRQVTSAFARGLGFAPELVVDGPLEELPAAVRDDVTAVVREGLANVMRHARATEARACVTVGEHVTVEVSDDGVGTQPSQARSGLVNLAERAGARGGRFEILAAAPSGTALRWSVPARH